MILGRNSFADQFIEKFTEWAQKEFKLQSREILKEFDQLGKGFNPEDLDKLLRQVDGLRTLWKARGSESVGPLMFELIAGAGELAGTDLGIAFDRANPNIQKFINDYTFKFAESISKTSEKDVRRIILKGQDEGQSISEIRDGLREKFKAWTENRADSVARTETIRSANQGARLSYKEAGVTKLVWSDSNDDDVCPYCTDLDGKVIGIDESFIGEDEDFHPEGASRPLDTSYDGAINSPPEHAKCRCGVLPVIE